jgi:RNA-directed DNA polymerase
LLNSGIISMQYRHGEYDRIVVKEKKRRDLAVATVRDRVVQRLVYDYLVIIFDKSFDPDVWSCRKGKGLYKCLERTQVLLAKYPQAYVWRADITKFFDNVNQFKLLNCIRRRLVGCDRAQFLCSEIIYSYSHLPGVGIPIGNITSQIFSNIYLNEFDRYVRHNLKPLAYLRYGDDFILFASTRRNAHLTRRLAEAWLNANLDLKINPNNNIVCASKQGLHFLGHVIYSDSCTVDKYTSRTIISKLQINNAASYKSLKISPEAQDQINYHLFNKSFDK